MLLEQQIETRHVNLTPRCGSGWPGLGSARARYLDVTGSRGVAPGRLGGEVRALPTGAGAAGCPQRRSCSRGARGDPLTSAVLRLRSVVLNSLESERRRHHGQRHGGCKPGDDRDWSESADRVSELMTHDREGYRSDVAERDRRSHGEQQ